VIRLKIGSAFSLCAYTDKRQKLQLYESEDFDKKRALFDKFVEEKGFSGWYETSAKENININEAATKLIEKVIENESKLAPPRIDADVIDIGKKKEEKNDSGCGCD